MIELVCFYLVQILVTLGRVVANNWERTIVTVFNGVELFVDLFNYVIVSTYSFVFLLYYVHMKFNSKKVFVCLLIIVPRLFMH